MAIILAAQSGNYSNTATWAGGVVPTTDDIAVCCNFRITLDVNPLATLSETNADWTAGGGTPVTHTTGGFTVPDGVTIIIPSFRYSFRYSGVSHQGALIIRSGNVTIGSLIYVEGTNTVYPINLSIVGDLTLTVGDSTGSPGPSANYSAIRILSCVTSANLVFNFANFTPSTGTILYSKLIESYSTFSPNSIDLTSTGSFYSTFNTSSYCIDIVLTAEPVGIARARFLNGTFSGTGTGRMLSLSRFKNVELPDLSGYAFSSGIGDYMISLANISESVIINGKFSSNHKSIVRITGSASLTINGDVERITRAGVTVTEVGMILTSLTGPIIINGDVVTDARATTAPSPHYALMEIGNSNFTCNNIKNYGAANPSVRISGAAIGRTFTVNGDVDCSEVRVTNTIQEHTSAGIMGHTTSPHHIIINGDIKGFDSPLSTAIFGGSVIRTGAISFNNFAPQSLTVTGTVYGGRASPAIWINNTVTNIPIMIKRIKSGEHFLNTALAPPAVQTVTQVVTVDELDFGDSGRYPVAGYVKFRDAAMATITSNKEDMSPLIFVKETNGLSAIAENIREGITIGSTTGTLVVPEEQDVRSGIVYDNGTVGTMDVAGPPDTVAISNQLDELETFIDEILLKTDLLTITTAVNSKKVIIGGP
jgi:hypothetical protein